MYCRCQHRVFQPTKNAFVDTLRSVVADVKWFLLFLVLTMWGFAGAFYILFREDQQQFQASSHVIRGEEGGGGGGGFGGCMARGGLAAGVGGVGF